MRATPPSSESIAAYISKLAGADAKEREAAAYALFRVGCASAEPVFRKWFADPEFRSQIRSGNMLLTVGLAVQPATFEAIRAHFGHPQLRLDVITPRAPGAEGPIAKFLARFGEGVQQVECDVRDVSRATEILQQRFHVEPVYPQIRAGSNQTRVNFFLVPIAENRKLLIELVESPKKERKR
jgi:hypothetical protein